MKKQTVQNWLMVLGCLLAATLCAENEYPLHDAVNRGDIATVKQLLENGADINARGGLSFAPLHIAVINRNPELVKVLLDYGANIEVIAEGGRTSLHFAAMGGSPDVMTLLLGRGADTQAKAPYKVAGKEVSLTPLQVAEQWDKSMGCPEVVKLLRAHAVKK